MAIQWIEGFDHLSATDILGKYAFNSGIGIISSSSTTPYSFGKSLSMVSPSLLRRYLSSAQATLYIGLAYKSAQVSFSGAGAMIGLRSATAGIQASLGIDSGGNVLFATTANNGTSFTTRATGSGATSSTSAWNYLEFQVTWSTTTAGTVIAYLNGVQVINTSSIITAGAADAANAYISVDFGSGMYNSNTINVTILLDDIYVCDSTGSVNNALLGSSRVYTLYPAANGRVNSFTTQVGGGGGHFTAVNETTCDDDTTYVATSTVAQEEAYTLGSLASTSSIHAVQVSATCRKDDAGTRSLEAGVGDGSTESFGSAAPLFSTYTTVTAQFNSNPLTSANWLAGDFATLQVAAELTA